MNALERCPRVVGLQNFLETLAGFGARPGSHLAHADSMSKTRTVKNPRLAVLFDGKAGRGENFGTFFKKESDFVALDGKDAFIGKDFKGVDASAGKGGPYLDLLDFAESRFSIGAGVLEIFLE